MPITRSTRGPIVRGVMDRLLQAGSRGRFLRSVPRRWAALIIDSLLLSAGLAGIFAVPAEAAAPPISAAGASIAAAKTSAVAGSISAGASHTCGIRTDGTVACWGGNGYGQATP